MRIPLFFAMCLAGTSLASAQSSSVEIIDWVQEGGHTYYLLSASDWIAADSAAVRLGGRLATIDNATENQFLLDRFGPVAAANAPVNVEKAFWIGLQDVTFEGVFGWMSGGDLTYTNWASGYPQNLVSQQDFVAMDASGPVAGKWKDAILQGEIGYSYFGIVEIPLLENLTINPPQGAISWWPAENAAWDVVGPAGGSMKNASLNGQGAYAPGRVGRAFSFDGTDDHVEAFDSAGLDLTGDFTIEAWIRHSGAPGERCIVSKRNPDNLDVSYTFFLRDGALHFASRVGGGAFSESAGPAIPANHWVHVAVTVSGSNLRFYKDGTLATVTTHPSNRPDTNGIVTIGGTVTTAYPSATPDGPFSGEIDELTLYNRPLSDAEIDAIYWVGAGGKDRHDPARDFSETTNPNGPWTFSHVNGGALLPTAGVAMPAPAHEGEGGSTIVYQASNGVHVHMNRSYVNRYVNTGAGGTEISWNPRQLLIHPAGTDLSGAIQWKAPEAGRFAVSATFTGNDARPTSTRVHLYHGDTALFPTPGGSDNNAVASYLGDGVSVTRTVEVMQDEVVSWLVHPDGNASYDNTGVVASVVLLESFGKIEAPTWQDPITTADPPMTGRNWRFHARNESRPDFPGMTAKIQYSATPGDPDSWIDLGNMVESGSLRFLLDTSGLPVGTFAFRIVTTASGVGTTYSAPSPLYTILDAAPHLDTELEVTSASDATGDTTHRGDLLTYTLRFKNSGAGNYGALKARVRFPDNTTTNFPAHVDPIVGLTTPGGQKVSAGDHFAWEWPVPVVRPVGDKPYGEGRTQSRIVAKTKKRMYEKTYFSMPGNPSHGFENGDILRLHQYFGTPLPTGLQTGRDYFVVNATAGQFQIAAAAGGTPILIKNLPSWVGRLHFERTNEWQTRKVTFEVFDPTPEEELAQANASLPPINAVGAVLDSAARVLDQGNVEIDSASADSTTVVNPMRLSVARVLGTGSLEQGELVTFELTAKNESSLRIADTSIVVTAPRGLAIQGGGAHPVFMDSGGQPAGPPLDASTGAQVMRPASWTSNPELHEAEIPGLTQDAVPSYEQQARFYLGGFAPGKTQKMRVTCRVQYDWDTVSDPEIAFENDDAVYTGALGNAERSRQCENSVDLEIEAAAPGSPRPRLSMWITQDGTGKIPADPSVIAVATVEGLPTVPQVAGSNPARGVNEILYRATYANLGDASANHVRLWIPIPENTESVSRTAYRTFVKTIPPVRRKGKVIKPARKITYQIPYQVTDARIVQAAADTVVASALTIVGGGTWFTCLVPALEPYPNVGWAKTLEFSVKLKPGTDVGTRIEQTGALVTSRELFYWGGVSRDLFAEVVTPARLEYSVDQYSIIEKDGQGNPTGFESLAQRLVFSNTGGVAATGAGAEFEIPEGFTFREARYVNATGTVRTSGIVPPSGPGAGQIVRFNTGTVASNTGGIAEVILDYDEDSLPDENSEPNPLYRFQSEGVFRPYDDAHPLTSNSESEGGEVAELGESPVFRNVARGIVNNTARTFVGVIAPSVVPFSASAPGEIITYRVLVGNHSNSGNNGSGKLYFRIPVGTTFVDAATVGEAGGAVVLTSQFISPGFGAPADMEISNPVGIIAQNVNLGPNSCVVIDFRVQVAGGWSEPIVLRSPILVQDGVGGSRSCEWITTEVADSGVDLQQVVWEGQTAGAAARALGNALTPESRFLDNQRQISMHSLIMKFGGTDMVTVPGHNLALIPLGGGRMVAAGAGNLIGQDGGSVVRGTGGAMVAAGAGNIVAAGAGNLITIDVPGHGLLSGSSYFGQLPQMVAAGAGNLVAAGGLNLVHRLVGNSGNTLIGLDGGSLIGLDGGSLGTIHQSLAGFHGFRLPGGNLLEIQANSGRMVAAGAGNLVGNSGNTLVGNSGNTMVAAGGGNMVAAGGLNLIPSSRMVAAGAGNILPSGAGGILPSGAGGILPSGAGNMVAAGAGNMVAAGAGNAISVGAGMVAAGGGN